MVVGITVISVGVLYVGYQVITNPHGIGGYLSPNKSTRDTGGGPEIRIDDARTGANVADAIPDVTDATSSFLGFTPFSILRSLGANILGNNIRQSILNTINPFNYATSDEERDRQFKLFLEQQNIGRRDVNRNLYPFTSNNPYDSWWDKFRKAFFGERPHELARRRHDEDDAYIVGNYRPFSGTGEGSHLSGYNTPNDPWRMEDRSPITPTQVGINPRFTAQDSFLSQLETSKVTHSLGRLPITPGEHNEWAEASTSGNANSPHSSERTIDSPKDTTSNIPTPKAQNVTDKPNTESITDKPSIQTEPNPGSLRSDPIPGSFPSRTPTPAPSSSVPSSTVPSEDSLPPSEFEQMRRDLAQRRSRVVDSLDKKSDKPSPSANSPFEEEHLNWITMILDLF